MLHQAVHGIKLGQIFAQKSNAVHQAQHPSDITFALQDGLKCIAVGLGIAEVFIDEFEVLFDLLADRRREFQVAQLAMLKQTHQAIRIADEAIGRIGVNAAIARGEAIELFDLFLAKRQERAEA